jgi:membrane protein implicated in regulation of membrane protease activity
MSNTQNRPKPPQPEERSQTSLWFAIAGLTISLSSFLMGDQMIGDVVLWAGGVFAVIALVYYFVQPTHGLPGRR